MSWMLIVPHFLGDHTALLQGSPLRVSKWSLGKDYLEIESDVEECLKKLAFISSSLRNSAEMIFFFSFEARAKFPAVRFKDECSFSRA
jgi:hypothetical protein